jgi:DNA-binding MarR family transcriptional regulator
MLDRLEEAGLARRTPSPEDRRAVFIERTTADRALEKAYRRVSARMTRLTYSGMSRAEIGRFESTLAKVLDNLERAERELKAP